MWVDNVWTVKIKNWTKFFFSRPKFYWLKFGFACLKAWICIVTAFSEDNIHIFGINCLNYYWIGRGLVCFEQYWQDRKVHKLKVKNIWNKNAGKLISKQIILFMIDKKGKITSHALALFTVLPENFRKNI